MDAARELGGYRLIRRIAVGGMAEIFEARQCGASAAEGSVVLKVLLPQFAADPEFIAMLEDEARLAGSLDHEHLVRVYSLEREGDQRFLVMEYVDGPTLAQLLAAARRQGPDALPPPPLALEIGRQLLGALEHLHALTDEQGRALEVVHRDVTPGNVLIDRRAGAIKLADFGIARHRQRQVRTRTGVIKGTVQYMAPEQVTGGGRGAEIDQRADLYCAGLLLFELLTGRPFIDAEGEVGLLRRAEDPGWTAPSSLRPDLDPCLDGLLRPALSRFPEERYANAASFAGALERAAKQLGGESSPDTLRAWLAQRVLNDAESALAKTSAVVAPRATRMTTKPEQGAPARRSKAWLVVTGLVVLALVGLALGLKLTLRDASAPSQTLVPDAAARTSSPPDAAPDAPSADLARADAPAPDAASASTVPRKRTVRRRADDAGAARSRPRPDVRAADPVAPLRTRRQQLLATLKQRGVLPGDLPTAARSRLRELNQQLKAAKATAASKTLDALAPQARAVRVDRALVEAKLKRVHARLRLRKGAAAQKLRDQASQALQAFMDGRYEQANRQLNRILAALR
jgi:eukaryotic-like serine/threonine-protein kinase